MSHAFDPTILREYDIRGIIGETLEAEDARAIGRSFGTLLRRAGGTTVAVGYDGRQSSPMLEHALVEGLTARGCNVVRIGLGATPMLYYAEASAEEVDGGIQITGSHNPPNYNGFKMVFQGRPFFGEDIQRLGEIAAAGDWEDGTGNVSDRPLLDAYVERLMEGLDGIDQATLASITSCTPRWTAPSPIIIPIRRSRRIWRTCARWLPRKTSISAWHSTAMETGSARSTAKGGSSGATSC